MSTKRKTATAASGVGTKPLKVTADMRDLTLFPVGTVTFQYTTSPEALVDAGTAVWVSVPASWVGADLFLRAEGYSVTAFRGMAGAAASGYVAIWKA